MPHLHLRSPFPLVAATLLAAGCTTWPQIGGSGGTDISGESIRLTLLHTSDLHSRLLPYQFDPSFTDKQLGLGAGDNNEDGVDDAGPFGGMARIGHILERERA